jgi:hypothetical protein
VAFNAGTILAQLKLNTKGFTGKLKQSQSDLKSFGKSIISIKNLMAGGFAAAFTVGAFKMADMGGQAIDLRRAFDRLAASAGTTGDAVIQQAKAITGALTNREIMQAANTMEIMGLGVQNLPRFLEIARAASIAFGKDVGFMLESITLGTARQSRMILDNLGIIVSADTAYANYAKSMGLAVNQLSEAQRKQAFTNEVMAQGKNIIEQVGAGAESAAEPTQSFASAVSDLRDAFARGANATLADDIGNAAKALNSFTAIIESKDRSFFEKMGAFSALLFGGIGSAGQAEAFRLSAQQRTGGFSFASAGATGPGRGAPPPIPGVRAAPAGGPAPTPAGSSPFNTEGDLPFVSREVLAVGIDGMKELNTQLDIGQSLGRALGDSFQAFGVALATGANAGKAFMGAMLSSIGGVMSAMGDFFISTGIGMLAIQTLQPLQAIAAGIALKVAAGFLSGLGQSTTSFGPSASIPSVSGTNPGDATSSGNVSIVVQGDFVGDRIWVQRLIDKINDAQRNFGNVEVVTVG